MAWSKAKSAAVACGVVAAIALGGAILLFVRLNPPKRPEVIVSRWDAANNTDDTFGRNQGRLLKGVSFAPGKVGQAFSFDGQGGHIRVPDAPNLHLTNAATIQAWIYPTALGHGASHALVDKWDCVAGFNQRSFGCGFDGSGKFSWGGSSDGVNLTGNVATKTAIPLNQWTFVAVTYDGATLKIYINGALDNSAPYAGGFIAGTNDLGIGGEVGGAPEGTVNGPFAGMIDALSIFNRAREAPEIQADYQAGLAGK